MIVEVLHGAIVTVLDCIGLSAGWADIMMKDQIKSETDKRNFDQLNLPTVKPENLERRSNLDEVARYVVEGLNRRKTEPPGYGSDKRTRQ